MAGIVTSFASIVRGRFPGNLRGNDQGAVSPLYAIALLALIAITGIGFDFDYGRLAAMQSELQNAADQAALAAATQLDGRADAMIRARSAATASFASAASAYVNETRIANDGDGRAITNLSFTFYDGYANDQTGAVLSSDADGARAKVVRVRVNGREVFYALTPVVGALSSGGITASAMAMLERSVCRLPPIMVCIERDDFPLPSDEGRGLRMRWRPSSSIEPLAPGNVGFLDLYGEHDSQYELGENSDYAECGPMVNVSTEPGFRDTETRALNTRFDIAQNPLACDPSTGDFCPSQNVRKNFVLEEESTITSNSPLPPAPPACGTYDRRSRVWQPEPAVGAMAPDNCFASGDCTYMGDGQWPIQAYLDRHHAGTSASSFAKGTRYEVYQWELQNATERLAPQLVSSTVQSRRRGNSNVYEHTFTNRCSYAQPVFAPAVVPGGDQRDRRVMPIAAVDCTGLNGRSPVDILGWFDVFIVQPGDDSETLQTEIIGPALRPDGLPTFQYFGHHRAVLVR